MLTDMRTDGRTNSGLHPATSPRSPADDTLAEETASVPSNCRRPAIRWMEVFLSVPCFGLFLSTTALRLFLASILLVGLWLAEFDSYGEMAWTATARWRLREGVTLERDFVWCLGMRS